MNFEWNLPTRIIFGAGRFASAHKFVRGFGKRALIITSRSFGKSGARSAVLDALTAQLSRLGVEWTTFSEIEPNPRTATVDRAGAVARDFRPRYVIGLGGGSVMDAAKCVALLVENEGGIYQYAHRGLGQTMKPFNHALPVVCIPTVAATGSEGDFYAVVTNHDEKKKVTLFGEALYPALSIIDPELTYSVGPEQTVDGAFDMITHVMESYLSSPAGAFPVQDRMTEALVESVTRALPRVLENPRDEQGRAQLSWCAALALSGVLSGREGGWPIHALEHGLSAHSDASHGRGLALILPRMMAFDGGEKVAEFNRRIFDSPSLEHGLIAYMKKVGAWHTLDRPELIPMAVDHALEMKGIWKRGDEPYLANCRPIYRADAVAILEACLLT